MNRGDVIDVDLGTPLGSEAGFIRPAVVLTADALLRVRPSTIVVVPLTSTPRIYPSHVTIAPDDRNGLAATSCAQVELVRSVAVQRCGPVRGNVGGVVVHQLLDILAMIVGMP